MVYRAILDESESAAEFKERLVKYQEARNAFSKKYECMSANQMKKEKSGGLWGFVDRTIISNSYWLCKFAWWLNRFRMARQNKRKDNG